MSYTKEEMLAIDKDTIFEGFSCGSFDNDGKRYPTYKLFWKRELITEGILFLSYWDW